MWIIVYDTYNKNRFYLICIKYNKKIEAYDLDFISNEDLCIDKQHWLSLELAISSIESSSLQFQVSYNEIQR